MSDATITIRVPGNHLMGALLGEHDRHLRRIEEALPDADITVRGNEVHLSGPGASVAATLFEELVVLAERGQRVDDRTLDRTIDMVRADEPAVIPLWENGAPGFEDRKDEPEVEAAAEQVAEEVPEPVEEYVEEEPAGDDEDDDDDIDALFA